MYRTELLLLATAFTLPRGRGPFPGLVLVHGSGPNDRDERVGRTRPFRGSSWRSSSEAVNLGSRRGSKIARSAWTTRGSRMR